MIKHDPFEDLIFRDGPLDEGEEEMLALHLMTCDQCRQLQAGWMAAREQMKTAVIHQPAEGFSRRWSSSLAERRVKAQKKQIKKFLQFLIGFNLFSLLGLVLTVLIGTTPLDLLSYVLRTGMVVFMYGKQVQNLLMITLHSVPLVLPVVLWVLLSTGFCLTVFAWGGTMYRYVIKGAPTK